MRRTVHATRIAVAAGLPALIAVAAVAAPRPDASRRDVPAIAVFEAVLAGANVAPQPVQTNARGIATALLVGNTLLVSGAFEGLGSALRDIEEKPHDPGVHIHPGARGETNAYLYGLPVEPGGDERSGTFSGRFTLTDEQVTALRAGRIYLDIHTVVNRPGEVRDQLRQRDASPDEIAALLAQHGMADIATAAGADAAEHCAES